MMDYAEKMQKCAEYVEALEVERRKIQVFERELPLCLELVSQAIDACRQQLSSSATECSEQTSSHGPVLEFIPIKPDAAASACSSKDGAEEEEDESGEKSCKKSDWLRSVQLWSQSSDPAPEVKRNGGAFRPFSKDRVVAAEAVDNEPASSATKKIRKEEIKSENDTAQRKQRRCWSPELHRRFIHALEQLGGANVATPKQIKERMKVDGLTNDEVKSHLQKYRLHMKRPSYPMSNNDNGQGSQFVVVGGIWVQPPEHAPATTSSGHKETSSPSNGVYAPVAKVGTPFARPASKAQNDNHEDRSGSHCSGSHSPHRRAQAQTQARSSSPVSSSSTHTTATATASPVSS